MIMKRAFLILAVVAMNVGFYSCEKENSIEETQALYDVEQTDGTDNENAKTDDRN